MPSIEIPDSPLAEGVSPVRIQYRDAGHGPPIVVLHGGWGYELYPFDRQIDALASQHRIVIPDRSGYGGSGVVTALPVDFHRLAMEETRAVIDALGLERPVLWGHSDGAIMALLFGLAAPDRLAGVIAEATHYYKRKPGSRAFFDGLMASPQSLGAGVQSVLERDHGARWPALIEMHSRTWRRIADEAASATEDFYGGRLGDLTVPALVVHGARDPRTEPGELEALRAALEHHVGADRCVRPALARPAALVGAELARPAALVGAELARPAASRGGASSAPTTVVVIPDGGHSPHSERATADEVTRVAAQFIIDHARARV